MTAKLLARAGEFKGLSREIAGDVVIGRSQECGLQLNSPLVSSSHVKITLDAEQKAFFLEDLGSLNGTELDGVPLQGRARLGRLHVIRLSGQIDLIWQGVALSDSAPTDSVETSVRPSDSAASDGYSDRTIEETLAPTSAIPDPSPERETMDMTKTLLEIDPVDLRAMLRKARDPENSDH